MTVGRAWFGPDAVPATETGSPQAKPAGGLPEGVGAALVGEAAALLGADDAELDGPAPDGRADANVGPALGPAEDEAPDGNAVEPGAVHAARSSSELVRTVAIRFNISRLRHPAWRLAGPR